VFEHEWEYQILLLGLLNPSHGEKDARRTGEEKNRGVEESEEMGDNGINLKESWKTRKSEGGIRGRQTQVDL
jgi:hypothetical protein